MLFSYNAFMHGEILQRSTTSFLCFLYLARAKQRQVTLQSFGVDQPTCPIRLRLLYDWEVKVALHKKRDRLFSTYSCYNIYCSRKVEFHCRISGNIESQETCGLQDL